MFIFSTIASNAPLRVGDIRTAVTLEEAQTNAEKQFKNQSVRIWKVGSHEKPLLVAERRSWRDDGNWKINKRAAKLLGIVG